MLSARTRGFRPARHCGGQHQAKLVVVSQLRHHRCDGKDSPHVERTLHHELMLLWRRCVQGKVDLSSRRKSYLSLFVSQLYAASGEEIGGISKQWSGFLKEAFTDADNFGIKFPVNLDVNLKATLLGAVFLIVNDFLCLLNISFWILCRFFQDFMYFENNTKGGLYR
jgi:Scramblase